VFVYKLTAHIFGGATETAVANVTMFIDVSMSSGFSSSDVLLSGEDRDHTGIESGGGGGIEGDANAVAATAEGNERCDDAAASQSTAVQNELATVSSSGT